MLTHKPDESFYSIITAVKLYLSLACFLKPIAALYIQDVYRYMRRQTSTVAPLFYYYPERTLKHA